MAAVGGAHFEPELVSNHQPPPHSTGEGGEDKETVPPSGRERQAAHLLGLMSQLDLRILTFFSAGPLQLCQVKVGHVQVCPQIFAWVQVRFWLLSSKTFTVVPQALLCGLGCVFSVFVL